MKLSVVFFSDPKSSKGSDQRISHIRPCVGGSLNLLICMISWTVIQGKLTHGAKVVKRVQLRRETAVDTQELLVHNSSQWQIAERFHAGVVDGLRIFVLAWISVYALLLDKRQNSHSSLKVK